MIYYNEEWENVRGKTYYTAKGLTKAALAVHAIPILWAIISNYMIGNRVDDRALQNYGIILLIGKALIPIAVIISFLTALVGIVFSAVSKKQNDQGAGKLLAVNIVIAVIMGAGIMIVAWYIWFFHNLPAM